MSIDRSLLQQVKQAMHKLAAPVPPEEVTAPKPYVKPQYLEPQQPYVDAGPAVIPGSPDPEKMYEAFKTPQQKAIDEYNDYISKSFSDFKKLPFDQLKPGVEGFDFKNAPGGILAGVSVAPLAAQIPPVRALMNKFIDDYKKNWSTYNGKPVNQGWAYWQKPYTGNFITDTFQGMLNSRTNTTSPWLDESKKIKNELDAVRAMEDDDNISKLLKPESVEKQYGRAGEAARLHHRAFPRLSSQHLDDLREPLWDLEKEISQLKQEGRKKFNLTPEQDFAVNPEAQRYYEEKVHPLQRKSNSLRGFTEKEKFYSSAADAVLNDLGISERSYLDYPESVENDYGALSDWQKKLEYTRQGNDIGEKLKNAPWAQIGRAAAISSKPLLGYLTPGKPVISESLPTRLGRTAAQGATQALTAFPYADRGYGGFYPRVDPNKPATKPNIPYSPASHMDAGPPMLDRRFSRMDVDAAKPQTLQPPKPPSTTPELPAIPSESPLTRRLSGGRGY